MNPLPIAFLERMRADLGPAYDDFLKALGDPPPVSIRLNPAKQSALFRDMEPVPWHPNGRYLLDRPVFTLDPSFHAGAYYVQEASSMLIHEAIRQTFGIGQNLRVLDMCAAPGGKSTLLLSAIGEQSILVSNEAIQSRIPALKMNIEKWGSTNAIVSNHDPKDFALLRGFFDLLLVDAPCSGEGLFRKDSDAASHWSEEHVEHCAARQNRILDASTTLVREGGILVYSTCTFNAKENEENVEGLVHLGFEHLSLDLPHEWGIVGKKYGYQCYPHNFRGEGFFFAVLRKTGAEPPMAIKPQLPKDWQKIPEKNTSMLADWFEAAEAYEYFMRPEGTVVALPKVIMAEALTVATHLKRRSLGIEVGEMKKQDFIPSHNLALSLAAGRGLRQVELSTEMALRYLKKENIWQEGFDKGWTLASYLGLPLGWLKVMENRSNNYLPTHWRIRMDLN